MPRTVFHWLLDLCITQAFILHRMYRRRKDPTRPDLSVKDFRLQLCTALLERASSMRNARLAAALEEIGGEGGEPAGDGEVLGGDQSPASRSDPSDDDDGGSDDDGHPVAGAGAGAGAADPLRRREFVPRGGVISPEARAKPAHALDFLPTGRANFHRCYVCGTHRPRIFCETCRVYLCGKPGSSCYAEVHKC